MRSVVSGVSAKPPPIESALSLPNGARFYKCALQVNPFGYLLRNHKPLPTPDEATYNSQLVARLKAENVEIVAVADHYRIGSSKGLMAAIADAGITVFAGFEAVTKDGVHFVCLLDPVTSSKVGLAEACARAQAKINDCGIHTETEVSPIGKYDSAEFLSECRAWGAIAFAAHAADGGGMLRVLKGLPRAAVWTDENLLACSIASSISALPADVRPIVENQDSAHKRNRPLAVLNAQDVNSPSEVSSPGATCWIKMSGISLEGLRQAFLDPGSRIRLATDLMPENHTEFVAVAWQGGFLDGQAIHFNENLNVLVGGRGSGKSTVVESVRYVLGKEPLGEDATKIHEGIVSNVLRSGTKVSLRTRSYTPDLREYVIERVVPDPPVVRDINGTRLALAPSDVVPSAEVYGQHEIAEITKDSSQVALLLERLRSPSGRDESARESTHRDLVQSRTRILALSQELSELDENLAQLPRLQEKLKRFQEAGIEARLKEAGLLTREDALLRAAEEKVRSLRRPVTELAQALPVDASFLEDSKLRDLPNVSLLKSVRGELELLGGRLSALSAELGRTLDASEATLGEFRAKWKAERERMKAAYDAVLRELQESHIDGQEFLDLKGRIEALLPVTQRRADVVRDLEQLATRRQALLADWDRFRTDDFRSLTEASGRVAQELARKVKVEVGFSGNREPLLSLLRERVSGRLSEALDILAKLDALSVQEFTQTLKAGADSLVKKYGMSLAQAERLAGASSELLLELEELQLPHTVNLFLNVSDPRSGPTWKRLDDLSTGQKATAVLLLLLLESRAPLVVDQPEDDLDNRFISDSVVPKIREEKRRRQFLFTTHNANIPVLGDSELIVGLTAAGDAATGAVTINQAHMGSIDSVPIQRLVEELLEGGEEAFEMRRLKYGF
jgi:DNA repair ATPase RecN